MSISPLILDHARNPRYFGNLTEYDNLAEVTNPLCGDSLQLFVKWTGEGAERRVDKLCFIGRGCALCLAAASVAVSKNQGATRQEISRYSKDDVLCELGLQAINPLREGCVSLIIAAFGKI